MSKSWTIYASHTKKLEDKYIPPIKKVITSFRSSFISDMQQHGKDYAVSNLSQDLISEPLLNIVGSIYKTAGLMGAKLQAAVLPTLSQLRNRPKKSLTIKAGGRMGINEQWIRTVQEYLKLHRLDLVSSMTDTMKDDIVKLLQKGVEEGWSVDKIVSELRRTDLIESRAKVIARTEVNRAANVGHAAAAQSMPYEVNKKWSSAKDHRVRHSHMLVNANIVDENAFFDVAVFKGDKRIGTEQMLYPGDPKASAGNTVNCRCRVLYEPKTDANGNIIMRNPNQAPVIPMRQAPSQEIGGIAAVLKSRVHIGVDK